LNFQLRLLDSNENTEALLFETRLNDDKVDNVDFGGDLRSVMRIRQTSSDIQFEFRVVINLIGSKFDCKAATVLDKRSVKHIIKGRVKALTHILK